MSKNPDSFRSLRHSQAAIIILHLYLSTSPKPTCVHFSIFKKLKFSISINRIKWKKKFACNLTMCRAHWARSSRQIPLHFIVVNTGSPRKQITGVKSWISHLETLQTHAINPTSTNVNFKKTFIWMTLYEKNLQIHTANFAISKINNQVSPVMLKAESTVLEIYKNYDIRVD